MSAERGASRVLTVVPTKVVVVVVPSVIIVVVFSVHILVLIVVEIVMVVVVRLSEHAVLIGPDLLSVGCLAAKRYGDREAKVHVSLRLSSSKDLAAASKLQLVLDRERCGGAEGGLTEAHPASSSRSSPFHPVEEPTGLRPAEHPALCKRQQAA